MLLIRRAEHPRDQHSGQVGFPGGRVESSDTNADATALREAGEEIALPAEQVRILGRLRGLRTVSNFLVQPVVGHIHWPQSLCADPQEVAHIFSIPLDLALRRRNAIVWRSGQHRGIRRHARSSSSTSMRASDSGG